MGSKESKDRREGRYIVGGRAQFLGGVVDVATEDSNKDVLISATRFDRQLTGEVRCRRIVAGNSTDEGGAVEGGRV